MKIVREIRTFINKYSLGFTILIVGSSAGCVPLGNKEVNQVQPTPVQQPANLQNNTNFIAEVVQKVGSPLGNTLQLQVSRNNLTQIITVRPEQLPAATSN